MMPKADGRVMTLFARFQSAHPIQSVVGRLQQSGIIDEDIEVFSDRPLSVRLATRSRRLVGVAVIAGIVGILLGIGLAAGTAMLYPIMTGGKPIVAIPVVGLISYETMMLCAIVATIAAMAIAIIRSSRTTSGIPELKSDEAAVAVRLDEADPRKEEIQHIFRDADAIECRVLEVA
jgi:hypothetical protein